MGTWNVKSNGFTESDSWSIVMVTKSGRFSLGLKWNALTAYTLYTNPNQVTRNVSHLLVFWYRFSSQCEIFLATGFEFLYAIIALYFSSHCQAKPRLNAFCLWYQIKWSLKSISPLTWHSGSLRVDANTKKSFLEKTNI